MMALGNMRELVFIVSVSNNELFMVCLKLLAGVERNDCSRVKGEQGNTRMLKAKESLMTYSHGDSVKQIVNQFSRH